MLPGFSQLRFFLYPEATDMRKGFDGLCGILSSVLKCNPLSGDIYLFINRRRDRMKLLFWERTGFWLFYKRLEKGTFELPPNPADHRAIELSYDTFMLLLEGIELTSIKRRIRYQ